MRGLSKKWLYLPIDIKVRELHAKLLIAAEAAFRGYCVVLGRKAEISSFVEVFPKGVFVGFGVHANFKEQYASLKSSGHSVVAMDEEGLLTFSDDMFKRLRLSAETIKNTDAIVTWGDRHREMVQSFCNERGIDVDIAVTGNARFDILSPKFHGLLQAKADLIREKYNPYFLIVSSFGSCNHFEGRAAYTQALIDKKIIQTESDRDFYESYFNLKQDNLDAMCALIPEIVREYPSYNIVIRPHPSEDHSLWEKFAQQYDRVSVLFDGNIQPWIMGADVVLHHFCTTALEAYVCDIPAIAIRAKKDCVIETELPYNCSYEVRSIEDFKVCMDDILNHYASSLKNKREGYQVYYKNNIAGIETVDAYERIVDVFDKHCPRGQTLFLFYKYKLKAFLKRLLGHGMRKKHSDDYQEQKFDKLDRGEVLEILNQLARINEEFKGIKVQRVDDYSVILYR